LSLQGIAEAHAAVVSTTPANWQVLTTTPTDISMTFSEPVDLGLATVRVVGPAGDTIGTGEPAHAEGRPEVVTVAVPRVLTDGTYTVTWHVTSADTHPAKGAFAFSVGQPTATPSSTAAPVEPGGPVALLFGAARGLSFAALALFVGAAFFAAWCLPAASRDRRWRVLLWSGWCGLVVTTVLVSLLYGPYATGGTIADTASLLGSSAGTRMGVVMLLRLALLGLLAAGLLWFLRREEVEDPPRRTRAAVVLVASLGLAATWSAAAHSATGVVALAVDAVHLTAMAVWLGGLAVVAAVPLRSGGVAAMRVSLPRFSRVAVVSVILMVLTGLFQSWRLVGTAQALVDTTYGRLLLVKAALVVVLVGSGLLARRWVRRHYGFPVVTVSDRRRVARGPDGGQVRRFGTVVAVEAGIAVLVLGLTAVLVGTDSARVELAAAKAAATAVVPGVPVVVAFDAGGVAGRGRVSAVLTPGSVGANELHITVLDEQGRLRGVEEVRANITLAEASLGPLDVPMRYSGTPGHYISEVVTAPVSGRWELSLSVRTSDVDEAIVRLPVGIA
jgi:copper transport protein